MTEVNKVKSAVRLAALQKVAAADRSELRRLALLKSADVVSDVGATLPTHIAGQIPRLGILPILAGMGGSIGGLVVKPKGDKNPETQASSLIPGVGQFRLAQRSRRMADMSERAGKPGIANLIAEKLGPVTSSLIGAGAGALGGFGLATAARGGLMAKVLGLGVGAGVGVTTPVLIAALAAAIKRRRTNAEQVASDTTGRAVAKYLVPGLATYDSFKRLGASSNNDEKKASVNGDALLAMSRRGKKLVGGISGAIAGGVAGAGAGGLYGLAGIATDKEKRKKWLRTLLGSAALGAGAGAIGGGYYGQGVGPLVANGLAVAAARNEEL